ncbi:MAG: hypothetical protein NW207_00150 [Cytophagales bacterium]|nr:hypothetical protein [Cytophagales bacterium]
MKFLEDNQAMACENCPSYGLDEITVTAPSWRKSVTCALLAIIP